MRLLNITLLLLFCLLQFKLLVGDSSLAELWRMRQAMAEQQLENDSLRERNRVLGAVVRDLHLGLEVIEDRARYDLGLVHPDETFFQIER